MQHAHVCTQFPFMCKPPFSPELLLEGRVCVSCELCRWPCGSVAWHLKLMLLMLPPIWPVLLLPAAACCCCSLGIKLSFTLMWWPLHTVLLRCILQASRDEDGWTVACTACTEVCKELVLYLHDKHQTHAWPPPRLTFGLLVFKCFENCTWYHSILPSKALWTEASIPHFCHGCIPLNVIAINVWACSKNYLIKVSDLSENVWAC